MLYIGNPGIISPVEEVSIRDNFRNIEVFNPYESIHCRKEWTSRVKNRFIESGSEMIVTHGIGAIAALELARSSKVEPKKIVFINPITDGFKLYERISEISEMQGARRDLGTTFIANGFDNIFDVDTFYRTSVFKQSLFKDVLLNNSFDFLSGFKLDTTCKVVVSEGSIFCNISDLKKIQDTFSVVDFNYSSGCFFAHMTKETRLIHRATELAFERNDAAFFH